ncbi:hypothetical protein [Butyrivibrio sp. XBB1001]|uniref:hypothetical protein n=1 Tax=Butyrivibrio sp. XBB1001 TaxID=1280682 RepID=UPI00040B53C7|nr:hypothetical protein [Butyrivibrio sp. XBB1001]
MALDKNNYKEAVRKLEIGIISVIIFVLCIAYGDICYETNDDVVINMIAAGAYGEPSQYLVYSGILWGYFIKALYVLFPGFNCYLLSFLFFNLLSMFIICQILSEKLSLTFTAVLTVIVNLLLFKDFYVNVQYSKNAAIYVATGFVLISCSIFIKKRSWCRLITGGLFLALGLAVRKESMVQVAPLGIVTILAVLMISHCYGAETESKICSANTMRKIKGNLLGSTLKLLIPIAGCLLVLGTNYIAYHLNSDWDSYYQWDKIMVQKRDFGNYNFERFQDEYLANGFTEWDFRLMEEWMWNDCDNYSLDKIKLMAEIGKDIKMNRFRLDTKLAGDTAGLIGKAAQESNLPILAVVVLLVSVVYFIVSKNWTGLIGSVFLSCGVLFEMYYLACLRRAPWRAEFGIWFAGILFILTLVMLCSDNRKKVQAVGTAMSQSLGTFGKKVAMPLKIAGLICAVIALFFWQKENLDYSIKSWENRDYSRYNYIKSINETDGLFVMSINEMFAGLNGATNIWDINRTEYEGFYHNIIAVGGWVIPSPIGMYYAHENGVSNVFKAFSERDDIYYIGGGETMGYLLVYQNEKYGPGISVKDVEFDWGNAWQFYRENF